MFFRNGERLIIQGENLHRDYQKYNQIARGLFTSKVGEIAIENVYRVNENRRTGTPKYVELSVWRVADRNVNMWERGIDRSQFVTTKPNGERISYVLVPRMNTDAKDRHPTEYTREKAANFEDVNDPRTVVIARSYKGVVAEIAKDFVLKNESAIRTGYKFLTDEQQEGYSDFSNPLFLKTVTEQAIQMFEPNIYQSFKNPQTQQSYIPGAEYVDPLSDLISNNYLKLALTSSEAQEVESYEEFNSSQVAYQEDSANSTVLTNVSGVITEDAIIKDDSATLEASTSNPNIITLAQEPIIIMPPVVEDVAQQ